MTGDVRDELQDDGRHTYDLTNVAHARVAVVALLEAPPSRFPLLKVPFLEVLPA